MKKVRFYLTSREDVQIRQIITTATTTITTKRVMNERAMTLPNQCCQCNKFLSLMLAKVQ